jgi:hypothetical protein
MQSHENEIFRRWRIHCLLSMRPTDTGNISVAASHPWLDLASVTQALLPVSYA